MGCFRKKPLIIKVAIFIKPIPGTVGVVSRISTSEYVVGYE